MIMNRESPERRCPLPHASQPRPVYFYRLRAGSYRSEGKVVHVR